MQHSSEPQAMAHAAKQGLHKDYRPHTARPMEKGVQQQTHDTDTSTATHYCNLPGNTAGRLRPHSVPKLNSLNSLNQVGPAQSLANLN
jgi:hypothetical protein